MMTTRRRNPSGFVRKHPDTATTRWQGIIKYPDPDAPGRWKQRSATFARRVDAQKWVDATITEHRRTPQYRPPSDITVGAYFAQWLDEAVASRVQDTTLVAYRRYVQPILKEFSEKPLAALSAMDLQGLYSRMLEAGKATSTVRHVHVMAHSALAEAVRMDLIPVNAADRVKPPRLRQKEIVPPTIEQSQALLREADNDRLKAVWWVIALTGCRRGEALGLKWDDIDWKTQTVYIQRTVAVDSGLRVIHKPKTARGRRSVAMSDFLVDLLKGHQERQQRERITAGSHWVETGYVFVTRKGTLLWPGNVRRRFKQIVKAAGLPPTTRIHDLRHAMATLWLTNGVPIKVVSERLGHANISVTLQIYGHLLPNMQAEATQKMDYLLADGNSTDNSFPEGEKGAGRE